MYYPLQACQKANDLYIGIKRRFEVEEENMPLVIQAIYDSYMDQEIFLRAKKAFFKEKIIFCKETLLPLTQKVYNGDRDEKENLLKTF